MGSNINYLYRKFSELNSQIAMRTELDEFLKERIALYQAQVRDMTEKYKSGTMTDEEKDAFIEKESLLYEFLNFSNQAATELIKALEECNRIRKVLMHKQQETKG